MAGRSFRHIAWVVVPPAVPEARHMEEELALLSMQPVNTHAMPSLQRLKAALRRESKYSTRLRAYVRVVLRLMQRDGKDAVTAISCSRIEVSENLRRQCACGRRRAFAITDHLE